MSGHGTPIPMQAGHANPLTGEAHVPGDKSISHRSLMFGAMAVGKTEIFGLLEGEDVLDTAKAMRAFGAEVTQHGPGHWTVHGVGVGGLAEPDTVIDCGNSGTGVRPNIGLNPTRSGLFITLQEMGADLTFENEREEGGEPVADLRARYSPNMKGINVPEHRAASMIDEYPILSVVAANATGVTHMGGVHELRVKESDRIDAMAQGLRANGVSVDEGEDWWAVTGLGAGNVPGGATCETFLDHRIAMSFLILGFASKSAVAVNDGGPIATSFPIFEQLMGDLGANIERISV
ncbi:MAG: hypothetical protein EBW07_00335 [Rhodobacteraceae bacterium]|nr:hypothetical protein [Paracoccaceae bacterium]